jgi:VRR-NUC domain.
MRLSEQDLNRITLRPGYSADTFIIHNCVIHTAERPAFASEWDFQTAVIAEARQRAILEPEYSLLVAIPNGQYRKGQRLEAGLCAGMPDLMLCAQRGGYGALFIELKIRDGKPSRVQLKMHHRLRMALYSVAVVWDSVEEVMKVIEGYLRL